MPSLSLFSLFSLFFLFFLLLPLSISSFSPSIKRIKGNSGGGGTIVNPHILPEADREYSIPNITELLLSPPLSSSSPSVMEEDREREGKEEGELKVEVPGVALGVFPDINPSSLFVIHNFLSRLPSGWAVVVVTREEKKEKKQQVLEQVLNTIPEKKGKKLYLFPHLRKNFARIHYSCLLLEEKFYNSLPSEHLLVFQDDTLLMIDDDDKHDLQEGRHKYLRDFFDYPFIGAPWAWRDCKGEWNVDEKCRDTGNGGLSLRRKSAVLEALEKIQTDKIGVRKLKGGCKSEDLILTRAMDPLFLPLLPPREVGSSFAVETIPYDRPFGVHKPWGHLRGWVGAQESVGILKVLNLKPSYFLTTFRWWAESVGLPLSFFDDVSDLSPKANIQAFNMEKAKIKKSSNIQRGFNVTKMRKFGDLMHFVPSAQRNYHKAWWNVARWGDEYDPRIWRKFGVDVDIPEDEEEKEGEKEEMVEEKEDDRSKKLREWRERRAMLKRKKKPE